MTSFMNDPLNVCSLSMDNFFNIGIRWPSYLLKVDVLNCHGRNLGCSKVSDMNTLVDSL